MLVWYIAKILFFAALLLGIAPPAALLIWQAATPDVAVHSGGAGQFLSATGSNAFLQTALTNVETTRASLIVNGLFSAPRAGARSREAQRQGRALTCALPATLIPACHWPGRGWEP